MITILQIIQYLLTILTWIIIIQAVLSWLVAFNVINTTNEFVRSILMVLDRITEPLYRPVRKIMPDFGALDLSPLVVLIIVQILNSIVIGNAIRSLAFQGATY